MTRRSPPEALLLDEMFSPVLGARLSESGFDVIAVAAGHPVLAASPDPEVARFAALNNRRLLTENVRDFAPLLAAADIPLRLLFTSSRRYPRSRQNPGPLLAALQAWLGADRDRSDLEWLE